jgi:hypothetical protein
MKNLGTADRDTVTALCQHLVKAFEQFATELVEKDPEGLRSIDALMGCHNFYKAVLLDLEERSEDTEGLWRHTAVDTLALALNVPIRKKGR